MIGQAAPAIEPANRSTLLFRTLARVGYSPPSRGDKTGYTFFTTATLEQTMKKNVGNIERAIRIIVGLVLISLVFIGPQSAWGWIGVVPLATGLVGWCPPYSLLGINTCKTKE